MKRGEKLKLLYNCFNAENVKKLSAKVGVSTRTLYNYFKSDDFPAKKVVEVIMSDFSPSALDWLNDSSKNSLTEDMIEKQKQMGLEIDNPHTFENDVRHLLEEVMQILRDDRSSFVKVLNAQQPIVSVPSESDTLSFMKDRIISLENERDRLLAIVENLTRRPMADSLGKPKTYSSEPRSASLGVDRSYRAA